MTTRREFLQAGMAGGLTAAVGLGPALGAAAAGAAAPRTEVAAWPKLDAQRQLRTGWAVRDITPSRPAMLAGQMYRRVASKAKDPLLVTALAVEGGSPRDCAILVSCDLVSVFGGLQEAVRERLAKLSAEVPPEKVFLNATHTHTSLVLGGRRSDQAQTDVIPPSELLPWVAERAAEAAEEAWRNRAPHAYAPAFSHAVVGHNRRAVYASGRAQMYGKTDRDDFSAVEGYEDHSLDLLFSWDLAGHLKGVAIDVPCPSQVDEHLELFSADYWHEVRAEVRARWGKDVQVLPLCGAGGDLSPHFIVYGKQEEEMRRRRGVTERQEIAQRIADGMARALACTKPVEGEVAFAHAVRRVDLRPRHITKEERDRSEAEYAILTKTAKPDDWYPRMLRSAVERFDSGKRSTDPVPVEIHVLRLGDLALATNPFELYSDYATRIKARSPAAQTVVVQLAAGHASYLPSERAVYGGGYGALPATNRVGPEGGAQLVEETLAMIRGLF